MDDFTLDGDRFQKALDNLESVLEKRIEMSLCPSHEKCEILMDGGIVLGHHVLAQGIKVDPSKFQSSILYLHVKRKNVLGFF